MALRAAFACALLSAAAAQATNIPLNLGDSGTFPDVTLSFTDLSGTPLSGQSLTLDFTFNGNRFVRLFSVTTNFEVSLKLNTNGAGSPGFLSGTGFLADENGNPLQPPQELGAASSNGWMAARLFAVSPDSNGPNRPFDFFDVHFSLTLPDNPSLQITGGEIGLFGAPGPFGVGPGIPPDIVPDAEATLLLLGMACFGLFGLERIKRLS